MNKKILLYLALMALGLYVMPNTVALFAGQHTFYNGLGVSCDKCHSDVASQLQPGNSYEKHKAAAGNINYTTYLSLGGKAYNGSAITDYNDVIWKWDGTEWQNQSNPSEKILISLDTGGSPGIDGDEICMLCHNSTLTSLMMHTGITVRVCDDDRCHGNGNYFYNSPQLFNETIPNITKAGYYLSQPNVHQPFYLFASNQSSVYAAGQPFGLTPGNANGYFISKGHWACEGCHTETGANNAIIQVYTFNHSDPNAASQRY